MFLGIDCGTQGTKALLLSANGNVLGRGYAGHDLVERTSGAREQEPRWWVDALRTSVRAAVAQAGTTDVEALAVSGQQHGLIVLDEHMDVIRPAKLWNDTETAPQNAALVEQFGGRQSALQRLGILPLTGYTASKLLWLKEYEPQNFARVRHILLPHEYLNFWLTGRVAAEYGDASGTGYFDPRSRTWIRKVLDAIDGGTGQLFSSLPPLLRSEEAVGTVLPERARDLGFAPGCLVAVGGGDNMMGAIGTGNVREGVVTFSLGTSSTVYSFRNAPAHDSTGSVAPFCSSTGGWLPLVCTMNATNVVTQTLQLLGKSVHDIEAALAATQPGAGGLIFLPFLNGERAPDLPEARGSIVGVAATNWTSDNLIRAIIEGVTFGILNGLTLILEGKRAETILIIGGGARSAAWRQLVADATGATIQVPTEEEAGCLGAAIQAMYAYGHATGAAKTFEQLTARLVRLNETQIARPNSALATAYRAAQDAYNLALLKAYPQLR